MGWMRWFGAAAACLALAACDPPAELPPDPPPIGDLRLAHVKVSAKGTVWPEVSRTVEQDVLETALHDAVRERIGRHKGNKWYHLAIAVEEVILAPPGIPIVGSLRSAMALRVVVWDDAAGAVLNEVPKEFTIVEPSSAATFIGSGHTRDENEQVTALSRHAASVIEAWLKSPEESPLPGVGPGKSPS